jgi:hypothetical protein
LGFLVVEIHAGDVEGCGDDEEHDEHGNLLLEGGGGGRGMVGSQSWVWSKER